MQNNQQYIADDDRPVFTFTTSSDSPSRQVECQSCGWTVSGDDANVFERADVHDCPEHGRPPQPTIANPYPDWHAMHGAFREGVEAAADWLLKPLTIDIPGFGTVTSNYPTLSPALRAALTADQETT